MAEIRRLRPDEWRELRALRLESLQDSPDAFWMRYEEELATPDAAWREWAESACFVAGEEGRFVGIVVGAPDDVRADMANLYAMYVTPSARGRGVGERLVAAVVDWARTEGFAHLRLMVNVENVTATRLYERCGFRDTNVREPLREGPHTLAEMIREL